MAEKLTPPEGSVDTSERREILMDLAKALKKQGSFQLASKKLAVSRLGRQTRIFAPEFLSTTECLFSHEAKPSAKR
jgi:hypothetical protein